MIRRTLHEYKLIFIQCFIITLVLYIILHTFDINDETILIAAIGSSCFSIFAMPKAEASKSINVLGGYCIGVVVGVICSYLKHHVPLESYYISASMIDKFAYATSISGAILIMLSLGLEHPPAVGVSFGIVVSGWNFHALRVIITLVIALLLTRYILKHFLHDLSSISS